MTTSYDYNAALRENGATSDKYYESKALGSFIQTYGKKLVRAEGGPCLLENAPKSLFGGIRVAQDGTRFIFLHNTDPKQSIKGHVRIVPGNQENILNRCTTSISMGKSIDFCFRK